MEYLVRLGLILSKSIADAAEIQICLTCHVRSFVVIGDKVGNPDALLNLVGVGILVDGINIVGRTSPSLENRVEQRLDIVRHIVLLALLLGTDGCDGAASDEQHDKYSFHIVYIF